MVPAEMVIYSSICPMAELLRSYLFIAYSDAKRPCSTCIRSHRNTVNHAPPGTEVPPMECTFDDVPENGTVPHAVPKNRYEKLENRISMCNAFPNTPVC